MGDSTGQEEDWCVNCSDEESYGLSGDGEREKPWQPSGPQIALLYRQLEKIGSIDLKWQCPGRRSPSVHSNSASAEKKLSELSDQGRKVVEPNEFDFDDEAFAEPSTVNKLAVPRRKTATQTVKKVAKLDKVMSDIKKYQIIDQQQARQGPSGPAAADQ